jgi:hypothetical protein
VSRRLLLHAGGTGSFVQAPPSLVTLLSPPNGGNNPWMTPGAYQYGGVVVGGYTDGTSGGVEAFTFDESTEAVGGPYTIHAAFQSPTDAHSSPALFRRSDGKIVTVYSTHNSIPINTRVSTNDHPDASAWGAAQSQDADLGGTNYTDEQIYELSDGDLFMLYRDEPVAGTDSRWCYSKSTDGGLNWSAQTVLFRISGTRSYIVSWKDPNSDLIHIVTTNGASSGFTKLGHLRLDGITLARTKSDGTTIATALPLAFADATEIHTATGPLFAANVAIDGSGYPVISGIDDLDYTYHRWNGSAWVNNVIVSTGTGFEYNGTGAGFQPWGGCVDDGDTNTCWLLIDSGGNPNLWRYRTTDNGASWSGVDCGAAGGEVHTIIPVRNPNRLRAYFPSGSWTDYEAWNTGLVGVLTDGVPEDPPPAEDPPFMTRTASFPVTVSGGTSALIEDIAIDGGSLHSVSGIGITISGVNGSVIIRNVDLEHLVGGIYIVDCTGTLTIENVRGRNIGDSTIGSGHSNYIQFSRCVFDGSVSGCKFLGGRTEDMISIYQSGGAGVGAELIIEDNALQGLVADTADARAWTSSSGTGIIVGDSPGDSRNGNTIVRNNTLLTPGQVGLQHIDGPNIYTYGNTVLGEKRALNNNPMTSYAGNPSGEVYDNTYYWTNNDDSHPSPSFGAGTMSVHDNTSDPTLDPADLAVTL